MAAAELRFRGSIFQADFCAMPETSATSVTRGDYIEQKAQKTLLK